eukprot:CAMPEP_0179480242 /NCGR_PEP_ID=MMETSP0799-20121207/58267_1 /TAXON_ID=46947 /ORGANISM="Geminigera cryophila, Strain CCMP2564" /LENGTH=77 /DNA_ID=CAMNT_0021292247 /DNA_START=72 /DNA_END=305 /DNA_ORIENTATION=+
MSNDGRRHNARPSHEHMIFRSFITPIRQLCTTAPTSLAFSLSSSSSPLCVASFSFSTSSSLFYAKLSEPGESFKCLW